jgi:hypothetical protein
MPTFLVESYLSKTGSSPLETAAALAGGGPATRYRCSLVLPDEDIGFHVVDGASLQVVREAIGRAALRCQRITEAVLISADDVDVEGGPP